MPAGTEVIVRGDSRPVDEPFAALESVRRRMPSITHAAVGPDTIAKFLLTSGSTGQPKAVINTQRMLCANQQMLAQALPVVAAPPPVLVDWLPWNHTAGGNHNFGLVLYNGGTLYIDDGKPVPGLIETHGAQPARGRADRLLQRAARLRGACCRTCATTPRCANFFSRLGCSAIRRRRAVAAGVEGLWTSWRCRPAASASSG